MLDGVELSDKKCNNKHIRRHLQKSNSIAPRGMFFWNSLISEINWKKTWLIPHKYCISNKAKEVHFKLLHNIYPTNCFVAKFLDIDTCCSFCKQDTETIPHLFFNCPVTKRFWEDLGTHFFQSQNITHSFTLKDYFQFIYVTFVSHKMAPWSLY